jgi:diketogulonate reductase-like aldo/keto reductase
VAASQALHRGTGIDEGIVKSTADSHDGVTLAQVMLRWSFQKRLIVVAKTANAERMEENRDILHFSLTEEEMMQLDSLTSEEDIRKREELELQQRDGV